MTKNHPPERGGEIASKRTKYSPFAFIKANPGKARKELDYRLRVESLREVINKTSILTKC